MVRRRAVILLSSLDASADTLQRLLALSRRERIWTVREAIVTALPKFGSADACRDVLLDRLLHDRHHLVRTAATQALSQLSEPVIVERLVQAVHHGSWREQCRALLALPNLATHETMQNCIRSCLKASHWRVRRTAAEVAEQCHELGPDVIADLIRRTYDHHPAVGNAAALALTKHSSQLLPADTEFFRRITASGHSAAECLFAWLRACENHPPGWLQIAQTRLSCWGERKGRMLSNKPLSLEQLVDLCLYQAGTTTGERNREAAWFLAEFWRFQATRSPQ